MAQFVRALALDRMMSSRRAASDLAAARAPPTVSAWLARSCSALLALALTACQIAAPRSTHVVPAPGPAGATDLPMPQYVVAPRLDAAVKVAATLPQRAALVVFDIDDTLLTTPFVAGSRDEHRFFGSDTWYSWQAGMPKGSDPQRIACLYDFLALNAEAGTMVATEDRAAAVVDAITLDKLILTSRSPDYRGGTERELQHVHVSIAPLLPARPAAIVRAPDGHAMTYVDGIYMTRGYDKGKALLALLDELGLRQRYSDVVLVDDGWRNILQMNAALSAAGIRFHGILYTGVKEDPSVGITDLARFKPFAISAQQQAAAAADWAAWLAALRSAYPERAARFAAGDCN